MHRLGRLLATPAIDRIGPEVDALVHRASESTFPRDRLEAVSELRDLLASDAEARSALSSAGGFPRLVSLAGDSPDLNRALLECLALAVYTDEQQVSLVDAQQLARTAGALTLLLSGVKPDSDFYVQYHSLQALRAVCAASPPLVQEAVQSEPLCIGALLDVLSSGHEVLRNESLLLFSVLVPGAPELAKLLAFEGGLDRLLAIAKEEGLGTPEPGLVACDCLELLGTCIRGNAAPLRMFLEAGHVKTLLGLLPSAEPALPEGEALVACTLSALRLATAAFAPYARGAGAPHDFGEARGRVLAAAAAAGWPARLLALGLTWRHDAVQGQALLCLACALREAPGAAEEFGARVAAPGAAGSLGLAPATPAPALLLAGLLLDGGDGAGTPRLGPRGGAGAERILEGLRLGPGALLSLPIGSPGGAQRHANDVGAVGSNSTSLDAVLARVLIPSELGPQAEADPVAWAQGLEDDPAAQTELLVGARACTLVASSLLLPASAAAATYARHDLLRAQLRPVGAAPLSPAGRPPAAVPLLDALARWLARVAAAACEVAPERPAAYVLQAALGAGLRLALAWTAGDAVTTGVFLAAAARAPFLMQAVGGRRAAGEALCRGLASLLLAGCALEGAADPASAAVAAKLTQVIHGQAMGRDRFAELLRGLREHPSLAHATPEALTARTDAGAETLVFSPEWARFLTLRANEVENVLFYDGAPEALTPAHELAARDRESGGGAIEVAALGTSGGGGHLAMDGHASDARPGEYASSLPAHAQSFRYARPPEVQAAPWDRPGATHAERGALDTGSPGQKNTNFAPTAPVSVHQPSAPAVSAPPDPRLAEAERRAQEAEAAAAAAHESARAAEARAAALHADVSRLESELRDLADAYGALDAHAGELQAKLDATAAPSNGKLFADAPEHGLQEDADEDELTDLLVCLGQEEAKVAALCAKLEELGVDSAAVLESVAEGGDDLT